MAKAELGMKRLCGSCGMRFYDFKRSPILCPGCSSEIDPSRIVKSRKSVSASKASEKVVELDDEALDIIDDDELDDQANVNSEPEDDDLDFDEDDMDADDADGPGIIQDDLGDDDELIPSLDEKEE